MEPDRSRKISAQKYGNSNKDSVSYKEMTYGNFDPSRNCENVIGSSTPFILSEVERFSVVLPWVVVVRV